MRDTSQVSRRTRLRLDESHVINGGKRTRDSTNADSTSGQGRKKPRLYGERSYDGEDRVGSPGPRDTEG